MTVRHIMKAGILMLMSSTMLFGQQGRSQGTNERRDKDDVKTIAGTVTSVKHPIAVIKGDDGKEYQMHMGPVWYWKRENIELKEAKIAVKGEVEDIKGVLHLYPWEFKQGDKTVALADKDGVPLWAGKGKGKRGRK